MARIISWAIILVTSVLAACLTQQPAITTADFGNGTYQFRDSFGLDAVTLSDGKYQTETEFGRESVTLVTHTLGEVGNLGEVGVAVLTHHAGGSGVFYRLGVYSKADNALEESAYTWLGDRVIIHFLGVQDGQIVLVLTQHSDDDPLCCPTNVVIKKYIDEYGELNLISEEIIGTVVGN
jgi:hypothetical protein